MANATDLTPEERARKRVEEFTGLMWHIASFVIINGFLWAIDLFQGGGPDWAFWVTIGWGIGVGFHIAAYLLDDNGGQSRRYQRYLEEERAADERNRMDF